MKFQELCEGTKENMDILRDVVELMVVNFPSRIEPEEIKTVLLDEMDGFNQLIKKYSNTRYRDVIRQLERSTLVIANTEENKNRAYGQYSVAPWHSNIVLNLTAFFGETATRTKDEIFSLRRNDLIIKSAKAILAHEVRHLVQSVLYADHFYDADKHKEYSTASIEIDAAWHHNLKDFDVSNYDSVSKYVTDVMDSFSSYKKLTPKQLFHYRKKTVRYYFDHINSGKPPAVNSSVTEKLLQAREEVKRILVAALLKTKEYDMREIPNYSQNARMFFFPERIFRSVANALSTKTKLDSTVASLVYLAVALATDDKEAKLAARYLKSVNGITLDDALAGLKDKIGPAYDLNAIYNFLIDKFS